MKLPLSLVACGALAALAHGQAVRGGDIVVADFGTKAVWKLTPGGTPTVLAQGAPLSGPAGIAVTPSRDVIVVDFSGMLHRITAGGTVTTFATGLSGPIRASVDHDGTYVVTALTGKALVRVDDAGTVTPIYSGAPLVRPFGIVVDRSGDYIVADDGVNGTPALYRITRAGTLSTLYQGPPFQLPQGVALLANGDYAVMDGLADSVFQVSRTGSTISTLVAVPTLGNPCGIDQDFEGGLIVSESGNPNGNRVVQIDRTGALVVLAAGGVLVPPVNLEGAGVAPTLRGPFAPTTGPGSSYALALDLPAQSSRIYALVMAAGVHPGIAFPNPDVRAMPLNPDGLFYATFGQSLPPITTAWLGTLDAQGQATAGLDLSILPPGALAGVRLHVQGLVLDPVALTGVRALTNAHVLAFR